MNRQLCFSVLTVLLLGTFFSIPSKSVAFEVAKYGSDYVGKGVGVRILSLGGAGTAAVNDVSAGFWNPAKMHLAPQKNIGIMHTESFAGAVNFDYAAGRLPTEEHNLGITMMRTGVDDIPNTQNALKDYGQDGQPNTGDTGEGNGVFDTFADGTSERIDENAITFFNSSQYTVLLSYSRPLSEKMAYGANFKLMRNSIAGESAWGLGFDVGAWYQPVTWVQFGGMLRNATTTLVAWSTGRNEIYKPELHLGVAGNLPISAFKLELIPTADIIYFTDGRRADALFNIFGSSAQYAAGLELVMNDNLGLRFGTSSIEDFTAGLGISLGQARLEYGFTPGMAQSNLGDSHRVGLLWQF
ncbi:MAG: hypothetical protein K9N46_03365 [Candidatus Marinimicrobia bacterium]|nr:hypothetical protein [Candidatus Neomarinimicrobiota bacterium]MCF7829602.1 hypothetical protein [Candidatus Neomarinimicrobiota bacterium]MCF7879762.1 hypothetical protein [Candidatus Neomarinimicrobiota bacterium]